MGGVICEKSNGLRDSEAYVFVTDVDGRQHSLRVEREFLIEYSGKEFLPVGIVGSPHGENWVLIELPHEADSGFGRLRVPKGNIREKFEVVA